MSTECSQYSEAQLRSFHSYLKQCRKILCVVGAGLSQSSGIPTYQLQRGSWKGYTSIDLATPEAFQTNPGLVWLFYSNRRYIAMLAKPNEGHFALAKLAKKMRERGREAFVVTQNMDGLHQRAGQLDSELCELHGSLFQFRCTSFFCTYKGKNTKDLFLTPSLKEFTPRDIGVKRGLIDQLPPLGKHRKKSNREVTRKIECVENENSSSDFEPLPDIEEENLPHCPQCREGLLRPDVVWFGEPLPLMDIVKVDKFFDPVEDGANNHIDLVLVIGTSGKVWPAMGYVERCKKNGGRVAIFNTRIVDKDKIQRDRTVWGFEGQASEWLPRALEPFIGDLTDEI